jgi:hypothetical protein
MKRKLLIEITNKAQDIYIESTGTVKKKREEKEDFTSPMRHNTSVGNKIQTDMKLSTLSNVKSKGAFNKSNIQPIKTHTNSSYQ